jgi:hypothetical protein
MQRLGRCSVGENRDNKAIQKREFRKKRKRMEEREGDGSARQYSARQ